MTPALVLAPLAGSGVGLVLALIGGGGSILAVPLLIYLVGVPSTHVAIGTSAVAVAASAAASLVPHWRAGHVKWPCALTFGVFGIAGALFGAWLGQQIDGTALLAAFGALMLVVGASMLVPRKGEGDASVRLTMQSAARLAPRLGLIGLAVGLLSGFFGIGGGFLIVPGLILATGMPLIHAIGTSLVAVSAFGIATASSYALGGYVDWGLAGLFIAGAIVGGLAGVWIGKSLAARGRLLNLLFALVVLATGVSILVNASVGAT